MTLFCGLEFEVTPDVLRPYAATERLVEKAVEMLAGLPNPRFIDVGTGSGNIVVSILKALPNATAIATDISFAALLVARRNAEKHGVADRVAFVACDALEALKGQFDAVVCNPPYWTRERYEERQPTTGPRIAITDDADGGSLIRKIKGVFKGPLVFEMDCQVNQ